MDDMIRDYRKAILMLPNEWLGNLFHKAPFTIRMQIPYMHKHKAGIILHFPNTEPVASGGGAGTPERSPPPEIGKIVVEIWCYLREVYTFGAESEIQEIFSKKL